MPSTFLGLTISYTGLQAAQTSLHVTGHNVSNINTDGYTRQQAYAETPDALRTYTSYGSLGTGVDVTAIKQLRDSYYDVKYRNNQANYGEYSAKNSYMNQIQDYLDEYTLQGYSAEYKNFFVAVEQVKNQPSEAAALDQLINNAKSMADYFNTLSTNLRNVQADANNEIKDAVEQINSIAKNIAALNEKINQIEALHGTANDLRDKRNALVDELSQIVNVDTSERALGNNLTEYCVYINGQALVTGHTYDTLQVTARENKRNASDAEGLYDVKWDNGQEFNLYSKGLGGQLRALVDIRDGCNSQIEAYKKDDQGNYILNDDGYKIYDTTIQKDNNTEYKGVPYYQAQLNHFVSIFSEAVNGILKGGYSYDGQYKGEDYPLFVVCDDSGVMNASTFTVNKDLIDNPSRIAVKEPQQTGEANSVIMKNLLDLQKQKIFNGGNGAYFLESIVGDMSIDTKKTENMVKNYTNLKSSVQNQRLSVMGVDADEEAMNMVKFQQAYNLNSKMLSVMNQIYDKLINQTGV